MDAPANAPATYRKVSPTRLRHARRQLRLTQDELAYLSGLTRSYVDKLERGVRNGENPATQRALADVLCVSVASITTLHYRTQGDADGLRRGSGSQTAGSADDTGARAAADGAGPVGAGAGGPLTAA